MITTTGTSANSYVDLTEAAAYMLTRVGASKWVDLDETEQEAYLLTALRQLELTIFSGIKQNPAQNLSWPRTGLFDYNSHLITSIPDKLKQAQLELVFWQLTESDRMLTDTDLTQLEGLSAGPLDIKVSKGAQVFPYLVEQLLQSIGPGVVVKLPSSSSSVQVRFVI